LPLGNKKTNFLEPKPNLKLKTTAQKPKLPPIFYFFASGNVFAEPNRFLSK